MNRWLVLLLAWLALLLSFVDRLAWSSVASAVGSETGLPLAALGIFASAFFAGYVLSNLVGGMVVDRLGPRAALGSALLALGLFTIGFSFVRGLTSGIILQALMGLAGGADYAACIKLVANWFPATQRARAIGLLMTSLSFGVIVANAVLPPALKVMAWPEAYRVLGVATLLLGGFVLAVLRDAPVSDIVQSRIGLRDIIPVLRNPELSRLALVGFGAAWGTWGFAFWATSLMVNGQGMTPAAAGLATSLFGAAAIAAKPVTGWLSDAMGGRRKGPIVAVLALYALGLLGFGELGAPIQFQVAALFLGFFGFSWGPLLSTLIAEVGGPAAGTSTGVANAIQQMSGVFVPLAIGAVFSATHSFFAAFLMMAAGPALAMIVMALFCKDADYARA